MAGSVFDKNNATYESLKSMGIELISNDNLRKQIALDEIVILIADIEKELQ